MSTGGVFKLITNSGIQDKLLMAHDKLSETIRNLSYNRLIQLKEEYPEKDDQELLKMTSFWMPELNLIEKTHVIFVNSTFKPFVSLGLEYIKTQVFGPSPRFGGRVIFTMPVFGNFVNDCVVNIQISSISALNAGDKVRWCEFLGHRLFKNVSFSVNGNPLDSYGSDEYNAYYQFKLPINKQTGYLRNIGQEIPKVGYLTPDPTTDEIREYRFFGNGPQTFKQTQPALDLWIPLLFWFKDIQTSLPNFLIPYGQTNVSIELEDFSNLIAYNAMVGTGAYTQPTITKMELYANNIFMNPEVYNILMTKFGFQLIRIHKKHFENSLMVPNDKIRLMSLKFPIEQLFVGFRPVANLSNSQLWWRNDVCSSVSVPEAVVIAGVLAINNAIFIEETPPVNTLSVSAHGVTIFQETTTPFYNSYLPYRFGDTIKTPQDPGWFMMNFGLNPNDYQPSGYINVSRAREFYLNYTSTYISSVHPTDLIVLADCINFLLLGDGSAVLRFAT